MAKFFVKLGLRNLAVLELIALAKLIVQKMTAAAAIFVTPDPPLVDISTAITTLDTSKQAVDAAKATLAQAVAKQNTDDSALQDLLTAEGRYVDNRANGDKVIIESAGMPVADESTPVGELPQVQNLSLTHGDNPGEVDAHWNPVKKHKNYTVQVTADPIGSAAWITRGNPTKSSITIDGLTSGSKVWVHVSANGTAGSGPYSDPAVIVVP